MQKIFREHLSRSVAKAITFRILAIVSSGLVTYIVTGSVISAFSVVGLISIVNTLLYILHERVWDKVKWGRKHH